MGFLCAASQRAASGPPGAPTPYTRSKYSAGAGRDEAGLDRDPAGLLQTPSKTPPVTTEDITETFGEQVAHIVEGVTKIDKNPVR